MVEIIRRSPVTFDNRPAKVEKRDNWTVVQEYSDEGEGPWITDLCHLTRWDVQNGDLNALNSEELPIPGTYGATFLNEKLVVNRMNRTQASVWVFPDSGLEMPSDPSFTETTDATVFLALYGPDVFRIAEKLTALDLDGPERIPPVLVQGPFSHVPCQIAVIDKDGDTPGLMLTCSRGYARDMIDALMDAGDEFSLKPAGEDRFKQWITNQVRRET